MKNVYVVRLGDLYYKERELILTDNYRYKMTDNLNDAIFSESFDEMKKRAEKSVAKFIKSI